MRPAGSSNRAPQAGPGLGPRLVIAGTHSGVGKTTVATGLMAALRAAGHRVAAAKVGPDFIDPGYHALACGRPPRNLDPWLCGPRAMAPLAARAGAGADLLVVEGVMGLFDGAADGAQSSTADVARLLDAPVVLVVDASAMSGSVAALVHGYASHDPTVGVAGVILNRVGSQSHAALLREALAPSAIPVLGALGRDDALAWRDRHLGLVPVAERPGEVGRSLAQLSAAVAASVDLAAVVALARGAPDRSAPTALLPAPAVRREPGDCDGRRLRVGVAAGTAFTFVYTDTVEALVAGGADVVPFDPLSDPALPDRLDGLMIGGGFPEVYAGELAANRPLLDDLAARVAAGLPTWAECGGLLLLCRSLDGAPMAAVVPARAIMTDRLTLGYRTASVTVPSPLGPAGTAMRGHEFHYSAVEPQGGALDISSRWGRRPGGFATPALLASYLHHHPGGDPGLVEAFLAACTPRNLGRASAI